MSILGFDVSHFQGAVNFAAARAASREFVVLKATDGIGYTDATFAANRKAAHAAGLIVGIYHFAEAGNPVNEAAYFTGVVGALQPGEFLVLDWEKAYTGDHVAWCKAWLDAVRQTTGVAPLIYMNSSTMNGRNWAAVAANYGLWLAKYDGSTAQPAVTSWSAAAMKQYSDKGTVLGVAGTCDVDVFYGTTTQLLAYCKPSGGDVALSSQDANMVWQGNGAPMVHNYRLNRDEWPATTLGALEGRLQNEILPPLLKPIQDAIAALPTTTSPTVTVDAQALAAALVADTGAVSTLADALAAAIAKRLGNG